MNILNVPTYDKGGASKACIRLHNALLSNNIDSNLLLRSQTQRLPKTNTFSYPGFKFKKRISNIIDGIVPSINKDSNLHLDIKYINSFRPSGLDYYSLPISNYDITLTSEYKKTDIVNLHWVANFLNWKKFFKKNSKPIVWTLHDQNPFLGGEHYAERFCGIDLNGYPISRKLSSKEITQELYLTEFKIKYFKNVENLHIVCPSKWIYESSRNSILFESFPHYHIPYGFPTNIFKFKNKNYCRQQFSIPTEKKVILFVADYINNARKGYDFLKYAFESLENVLNNDIILCVIGNKQNINGLNNVISLGVILDENTMSLAYGMADVFILPSLEDNLPNTMIESILCGTPVIAFNVGGIPDAIKDGVNGYLAPEISGNSLKMTIEKYFNNIDLFNNVEISINAKNKYDEVVQAKSYIALYNSLLN